MRKFKVGEVVKLIDNVDYESYTTRNKVYIVASYDGGESDGFNITDDHGDDKCWMFARRFKKVSQISIKTKLSSLLKGASNV